MDLTLDEDYAGAADPMDTVEHVIGSDNRFTAERAEDGDVHFVFKSAWGETAGYFSHRAELPALLFTLGFDLQAPASRRASGDIPLSPFIRLEISPFLPSASTRTCSSAATSPAPAVASSHLRFTVSRFCMCRSVENEFGYR